MVKLSCLSKLCRNRAVANTVPAHMFCRVLGNPEKPCPLDKICKQADEKGISYFYLVLVSVVLAVYIVLYWIFKFTRLNKPLKWLANIIFIPIKPLLYGIAYCIKFYKGLPR